MVGYAGWLRPRMARRGATSTEVARHLAGDDVIPGGRATATNAVTIDAAPAAVWPWIVQMGRGRAGFYTYFWIENLLGADIHNLDRIEPAFQTLGEGDRVWLTPERYLGRPGQYWQVRQVQAGRLWCWSSAHQPTRPRVRGRWWWNRQPAGERGC